jgi:hypothetical protein
MNLHLQPPVGANRIELIPEEPFSAGVRKNINIDSKLTAKRKSAKPLAKPLVKHL